MFIIKWKFIPRYYTGYIYIKDFKIWTARSGVSMYLWIVMNFIDTKNLIECDIPDSLPCYAFVNGRIIRWQKDLDE